MRPESGAAYRKPLQPLFDMGWQSEVEEVIYATAIPSTK
jgi:hypothetical protein